MLVCVESIKLSSTVLTRWFFFYTEDIFQMNYTDSYIGVGYTGCSFIIWDNNKGALSNGDDSIF